MQFKEHQFRIPEYEKMPTKNQEKKKKFTVKGGGGDGSAELRLCRRKRAKLARAKWS